MTTVERALAAVDRTRAGELLDLVVGIASPTGSEARLAGVLVEHLRAAGASARSQDVAPGQANVVAELPGGGGGPRLLLCAQLDTTFGGDPQADAALVGEGSVLDAGAAFRPVAQHDGDWVIGLGAENPKGYLVAAVLAFEALARSGAGLRLDLLAGLCCGGMPAIPSGAPSAGFGAGVRALLGEIGPVDWAVMPKPGFAVSWEEVGIAVYRIVVHGELGYTGTRAIMTRENALRSAARLTTALEDWFPEYTAAMTTAYTAARGAVVAIRGGAPQLPAFLPETSEITVDLRVAPGRGLAEVDAMIEAVVAATATRYGFTAECRRVVGIPGGATPADNLVVTTAVQVWEAMQGTTHAPRTATSGYTDAALLRAHGIPTARVGMPRPPGRNGPARFSMGEVHVPSLLVLTEWLIRLIVALDEQAVGPLPAHDRTTDLPGFPGGHR